MPTKKSGKDGKGRRRSPKKCCWWPFSRESKPKESERELDDLIKLPEQATSEDNHSVREKEVDGFLSKVPGGNGQNICDQTEVRVASDDAEWGRRALSRNQPLILGYHSADFSWPNTSPGCFMTLTDHCDEKATLSDPVRRRGLNLVHNWLQNNSQESVFLTSRSHEDSDDGGERSEFGLSGQQVTVTNDQTADDMTRCAKVLGTPAIPPSSRTTPSYTGLQRGAVGKQDSLESLHNSATKIPPTASTARAPPGSSTTSSSVQESNVSVNESHRLSPSFLSRSNRASYGSSRSGSELSFGSQRSRMCDVEENSVAPSLPLSSPGSDFCTVDDSNTEACKSSVENYAIPLPIDPVRQAPRSQIDTAFNSPGSLEYSKGDEPIKLEIEKEKTILEMDYSKPLRQGYHVYPGGFTPLTGKKKTKVAIKLYHIANSGNNWFEAIHGEVDCLMRLGSHPNVAQLIKTGIWRDSPLRIVYIAIRMYHKMTLEDIDLSVLQDDGKRHGAQMKIYWQICSGLKHLHDNNIAHLDLKPTNILFDIKGSNAIVSDFSISREVDFERSRLGTTVKPSDSAHGGTDGWRAAEMVKSLSKPGGNNKEPDFFFKADIFSLGLLGSYIFGGRCHPFRNKEIPNNYELCQTNINFKKPPDFHDMEAIEIHIFSQMLSHESKKRPNMKYVMGHPVFWDSVKRINFLRNMHERFEDLEEGEDSEWMNNEKLVLAFHEIPLNGESEVQENKNQHVETGDDSPMSSTSSTGDTSRSDPSIHGTEDIFDNEKQLVKEVEPHPSPPSDDSDIEFEDSGAQNFNSHPKSEEATNTEKRKTRKQRKKEIKETKFENLRVIKERGNEIPEDKRRAILTYFRKVIAENFVKDVKDESEPERLDDHYRLNSVRNLVRRIRNYGIHGIDPEVESKSEAAWKYCYERYPKFLTLLYDMMSPIMTQEHRKQYMFEQEDSSLRDLLDEAERRHALKHIST